MLSPGTPPTEPVAVSLAATGDPEQIIKTIDAGLDAFLSVPPDRFMATVKTLKAATSEAAKQPACNLICTPDVSQVEKVTESARAHSGYLRATLPAVGDPGER